MRASEPASHASQHASHASHHVSHARQMLVPSPFSFLRLLAIWHEFALLSISLYYLLSSFSSFVKVCFVLFCCQYILRFDVLFECSRKRLKIHAYYYRFMANRRLQSLLEANKRGLTLCYDPPASRNLCFYRCLSKFVDVNEEDIVQMVQRHLLCNQIVTCANEVRCLS